MQTWLPDSERSSRTAGHRGRAARGTSDGRLRPTRSRSAGRRTAYDFLFSLSDDAGSTEDLPSDDRRWLSKSRDALRQQVGDNLSIYGSELCILLAGLAVDRPDVQDAAGFLRLLNQTPDEAFVHAILADDRRDPKRRELSDRALAGDDKALDELLAETAQYHQADKVDRFRALFKDPKSLIGPSRDVLHRWLPFFAEIEGRIGEMLRRDYEQRAGDRATLDRRP